MKRTHWHALLAFLSLIPTLLDAQSSDIKLIKERVVTELLTTQVDDGHVPSILNRISEDGSFSNINYTDLSRTAGFPHRHHTSDLAYLAKAYQQSTSAYFQDQAIKQVIIKGLEYWVKHDFFGDNWHNNQISTPTNLVNLMLLIGDELPKELVAGAQPMIGRAHMNASGARPSGDRIVIAGILAKNLLFIGDYKQFDEIIDIIEGEIKFSTGKRGMQRDYSFHHRVDRVNNTDSYGYGKYANAFGEWSSYVAGTKYAFSIEKINQLVDYYLDGIYKQLVYGVYQDVSVKNRSITHKQRFEPRGTLEIDRLLQSTDYRKAELEAIIRLRKGESKPDLSFAKFFWQTEHFVFQRPNFYTTVRMYSTRNRNMEVPYNGPGKPTHHRADGTNYLVLKGDEYLNIWPVYDWQKVSGTTVVQKPQLYGPTEIQKDGLTDFVGAVTDGMYGAVAFDFKSPHDQLAAKKAWFFFDEEYVCLGTDIHSMTRLPVATTINQVLMRSEVQLLQNGKTLQLPTGSHELNQVKWVHHDRIGYLFPEPAEIRLSNQAEQGRWSDITDQKNISTEIVSEDVFNLWFDHGERPMDANYAYIVVPDVSQSALAASAGNNRNIDILSNTPDLQAVSHRGLGISQVAFYRAGGLEVAPGLTIQLASQGMVMLNLKDGQITSLTVADPSRQLSRMMLTLPGKHDLTGDGFFTIPGKEESVFVIDLPQGEYVGKSVEIGL